MPPKKTLKTTEETKQVDIVETKKETKKSKVEVKPEEKTFNSKGDKDGGTQKIDAFARF